MSFGAPRVPAGLLHVLACDQCGSRRAELWQPVTVAVIGQVLMVLARFPGSGAHSGGVLSVAAGSPTTAALCRLHLTGSRCSMRRAAAWRLGPPSGPPPASVSWSC